MQQRIGVLNGELENHDKDCRKIDQNNMYIAERDSLSFKMDLPVPEQFKNAQLFTRTKRILLLTQNNLNSMKKLRG